MSQDIESASTADIKATDGVVSSGVENPSVAVDAKPADSSTAKAAPAADSAPAKQDPKDVKRANLLDKVKSVLTPKKAPAEASPADSKVGEAEKPKAEQKPEDKAKAEVPQEFAKHPAWQRILKERDANKSEAASYRKVQTFLDENGVSGNDAAEALKLTALVYTNPQQALERIDAFRAKLAVRVGAELPSDLSEAVKTGKISQEHAKELSAARIKASDAETRATNTEDKLSQADTARETQDRVRTFEGWEATTGKTDPDLAKKLPHMNDILARLITTHGYAKNSADVVNRLNFAHKEATDYARSMVPQRPAKQGTPVISGSTAQVKTAPTNMQEQVAAVLSKHRSA